MQETRHTLIQRLQNQYDERAWETFVETYRRYIYAVLRRMNISHTDCGDLIQDILLKLWKKLPDFKYEPSKARFRTWLSRVIRNSVINYISSSQSRQARHDKAAAELPQMQESALDEMMDTEWQTYVTNLAMERVRPKFAEQTIEVFELSLKGVPVEEIAARFELKENSVYRLKNRVKDRLIAEVAQLRRDLE